MSWPLPLRIVGVGSPSGDDAIAWEAISALRALPGFRPDIEMHLADGGQRLLDLLDGRGTLLLVDAIMSDTQPGTIHRFDWPDQRIESLRPGSTHDLRPAEALRLAEALGIAPPRTIVFGISIENHDPTSGLSQPVRAALPELVRQIRNAVEDGSRVDGVDHWVF